MKLERYALIAQIVSGMAIVVTLVILMFEIRGNTAAVRAATYRDVVESITSILYDRAADPEVARIYYAGAAGDDLPDIEERRFYELVLANTRRFENAYYQYRSGGIDPGQWAGVETALRQVVRPPGIRLWWQENKGLYSGDFQRLVDDILAEH